MPLTVNALDTTSLTTTPALYKEQQGSMGKNGDNIVATPVTPDGSFTSSSASSVISSSDETVSTNTASMVLMTEHRRQEVEGKHLSEPLLMENPGRFVLFPIQHHDVSFPF